MPFYRDYYPPRSTPRKASGGIKAQTGRGRFASNWWSQRWIAVLESFRLGSRLTRGRAYARSGQVLSINIGPGLVVAKVQGSRTTPYTVQIGIKEVAETDWQKLSNALFSQALVVSQLLAGEMPEDLENQMQAAGVSLFPEEYGDLRTACSCPDWANPCKHTSAVYYLLAEEFDRSPMLFLSMRGITRERLMLLLGAAEPTGEQAPEGLAATPVDELPTDPILFWGDSALTAAHSVPAPPGRVVGTAALTRQLGSLPFWKGEESFQITMERIYGEIASNVSAMMFIESDF